MFNTNVVSFQFFSQAAKIVVPWHVDDAAKMRFMELGPFIFNMSDETFALWMQVYEKSREGLLVAYNGYLQKDVIKKDSVRGAWEVSKRVFRDFQGLEDDVL